MVKAILAGIIILLAITGCNVSGKEYEEPRYSMIKILSKDPNITIRSYSPMIVAEVTTSGSMKESTSKAFRPLADYIFGNNISNKSMDMTVPVTQELGEKMEMTVPVSQQEETNGQWNVRFYMSDNHTLDSLPKPNNKSVKLREIKAHNAAVIKFSGSSSANNMIKHKNILENYLAEQDIDTAGSEIYAYYNHPITPWFLKRNEVIIKLKN